MNRPVAVLGLIGSLVVAMACSSSANSPTPSQSVDPNALTIAAKDLAFSTTELSAPAGRRFQIVFDNQEGAPHNVAIYTDPSAAQPVFVEEPFGGPRQVIYDVPALALGTYFFRCDLHPAMSGTITAR